MHLLLRRGAKLRLDAVRLTPALEVAVLSPATLASKTGENTSALKMIADITTDLTSTMCFYFVF